MDFSANKKFGNLDKVIKKKVISAINSYRTWDMSKADIEEKKNAE
jgi:hypothetical protein